MLTIGLTGGIGSGKSTAALYFQALGATIIDADVIARELVAPEQPAFAAIVQKFGTSILTTTQQLDRQRLRAHIFADSAARLWLEALLHPPILEQMQRLKTQVTAPYVVFVIPLLLEKNFDNLVERILVIDTTATLQRERAQQRDGATNAQIEAILATQLTRAQRLAAADDVIENNGNLADLQQHVAQLHARYLALSKLHA